MADSELSMAVRDGGARQVLYGQPLNSGAQKHRNHSNENGVRSSLMATDFDVPASASNQGRSWREAGPIIVKMSKSYIGIASA